MERHDDAAKELRSTFRQIERISERGDTVAADVSFPVPLIAFTAEYLRGVLACARNAWNDALDAVTRCREFEALAKLPRYGNAVTMLDIDGLLGRNASGDANLAAALATSLPTQTEPEGIFGWSNCAALVQARMAVRQRRHNAHELLRAALDTLEENAHRMPLDADRAFAHLADAAEEHEATAIRERARARRDYYGALRIAAANNSWGTKSPAYA
jgi:hypothetical protein